MLEPDLRATMTWRRTQKLDETGSMRSEEEDWGEGEWVGGWSQVMQPRHMHRAVGRRVGRPPLAWGAGRASCGG
jgi:hypothetical protein